MNKGSITIYLSLILSIMLILFLVIIEGARKNATYVEANCAMDLGTYSLFADYQKELFKQYHLLFVDTSYGNANASISQVENHLEHYIRMNLSEKKPNISKTDFTQTFLEEAKVNSVSYATDEQAAVFYRQAVCYVKQKKGLSFAQDLLSEWGKAKEQSLFTLDLSGPRLATEAKINEEKKKGRPTGDVDENGEPLTEEFTLDNPADAVNALRPSGILALVMNEQEMVSAKKEDLAPCYSHCGVSHKGEGLKGRNSVTLIEKPLFYNYIQSVSGCYTNPKEEGALSYQMEYILAGKDSDEDNLKAVVTKLLGMREVSNYLYLLSDSAKQVEAGALALSICSAAQVPYLEELVKQSLLFAWAYAEAIYDVRELIHNKTVPLIKDELTWHTQLSNMLSGVSSTIDDINGEDKNGMTYEKYVLLCMMSQSEKKTVGRMIDLIEMDIRKSSGNKEFRMENCIDAAKMEASIASRQGISVQTERIFWYQ